MINLSQIPNTSKLKELRGQINTMANEINGNQMVIGQVVNPTAKIVFYHNSTKTVNVSVEVEQLFALCMLKSNSVYVAQVFGSIYGRATADVTTDDANFAIVYINIPSVKLPNRTAEVSSFVTPGSLGFTEFDIDSHSIINTGVQVSLEVSISAGSILIVTNPTLNTSSTDKLLKDQQLGFETEKGLFLSLS